MSEWTRWAAARALRLYPRAWRERYENEVEALLDRHDASPRTVADLLLGAVDAWGDPAFRAGRRSSLSRTQTLAGLSPFLGYGAAVALYDLVRLDSSPAEPPYTLIYLTMSLYILAVMLMPLVGLAIGWVRGFPTWSYPFLGVVVMLSQQNGYQGVPTIDLFGYRLLGPAYRGDLLGWRAWLPLVAFAIVLLLVTRSLGPLRRLVYGVWRDWTLLSLAVYGVLPLALWVRFDEVVPLYRLLFTLVISSILVVGALAYLRSSRAWQRGLALAVAAAAALALTILGSMLYWHGVRWFAYAPPNGPQRVVNELGEFMALLLAPALLGVLRLLVDKTRRADVVRVSAG